MLNSFRSVLARQISEAVLIQIAEPDMLLNSRGEWNVCSILRLVLEDKEPEEEWLSVRSKRKNISKDQGSSSSGSGGDSVESGTDECKTKKSKLAVPQSAVTSAQKRTAEIAISEEGVTEKGTECDIQIGNGMDMITVVEEVSEVS